MKHRKVYIIEDNKTEGLLLKLSIDNIPGLDIHTFSLGKDMLEQLHQKPDIALLDLMLPDIDGYQCLEQIQLISPSTKIIIISAQDDVNKIAFLQSKGIFNYIVKSEATLGYLRETLKNLLIILNHDEETN